MNNNIDIELVKLHLSTDDKESLIDEICSDITVEEVLEFNWLKKIPLTEEKILDFIEISKKMYKYKRKILNNLVCRKDLTEIVIKEILNIDFDYFKILNEKYKLSSNFIFDLYQDDDIDKILELLKFKLPELILETLANHNSLDVRENVAKNKWLTLKVIKILSKDKHQSIRDKLKITSLIKRKINNIFQYCKLDRLFSNEFGVFFMISFVGGLMGFFILKGLLLLLSYQIFYQLIPTYIFIDVFTTNNAFTLIGGYIIFLVMLFMTLVFAKKI